MGMIFCDEGVYGVDRGSTCFGIESVDTEGDILGIFGKSTLVLMIGRGRHGDDVHRAEAN